MDQLLGSTPRARRTKTQHKNSGLRRCSFELPGKMLSLSSQAKLSLDDVVAALQELLSRSKRAQRQGLDVSTFIGILRDEARKAQREEKSDVS